MGQEPALLCQSDNGEGGMGRAESPSRKRAEKAALTSTSGPVALLRLPPRARTSQSFLVQA